MSEHCDIIRVSQSEDTPLQTGSCGQFSFRYAYKRAAETAEAGDFGQDYLTFWPNPQLFTFALCDGVSQSYYGDLAAKWLGTELLNWLASDSIARATTTEQETTERVLAALEGFLKAQVVPATEAVNRHAMGVNLPPLVRAVLEDKRRRGSETTYICGRIDLPSGNHPDGRILLAWQGDSRLRIWDEFGEQSGRLHGGFLTEERWSTKDGPVGGSPHLYIGKLKNSIHRLAMYSDGLHSLDDLAVMPSNSLLVTVIEETTDQPTSDDISLLDISWGEGR